MPLDSIIYTRAIAPDQSTLRENTMKTVEYMERHGHEQLTIWTDPTVGLRAFIAIHDTTLGPALGGVRIWPHATEEAAIMDVLRLSRAMTYKSAMAGLPLGGGKGLIMADSHTDKTEAMLRSYGRFVETLNGRFITTEDVGASTQDLEWVSFETDHVLGLSEAMGGSGNPATMTALGVFYAMRACAKASWGSDSLEGRTVAIQGYGNVATALSKHLLDAGAKLIITDIREDKRQQAQKLGAAVTIVGPDDILSNGCDILAPCALGGILNAETIPGLQCQVVCGSANNQLADEPDADRLEQRGILYAPDYVTNAGGVINVFYELNRVYDLEPALEKTSKIYDTMLQVIQTAKGQGTTTARAADTIAEERLASVRRVHRV
jgi:leucine dehydrogenase